YEGQSYAMPPEAVGLIGVLRLFPDRVEIAAGRYETTHPRRRPSPGSSSYAPGDVGPVVASDANLPSDRPRPRRPTGSGPIPVSPSITGSAWLSSLARGAGEGQGEGKPCGRQRSRVRVRVRDGEEATMRIVGSATLGLLLALSAGGAAYAQDPPGEPPPSPPP